MDNQTQQLEQTRVNFWLAISKLFENLTEREKDVLLKRFKLSPGLKKRATLEEIGKFYNITRERVRQIESDAIKRLKELLKSEEKVKFELDIIRKAVNEFLGKHGGTMKEDHLIESIHEYLKEPNLDFSEENIRQNKEALAFIISQLLVDDFEKVEQKDKYHVIWKLKVTPWVFVEEVLQVLVDLIEKEGKPINEKNLIELLKNKGSYHPLREKAIGFFAHLRDSFSMFEDHIISYLNLSRKVKRNLFSEWGLSHWTTVSPKKMNDKIYLILKNAQKPLHFTEITEQINVASFDHKKACAATVHNELILDDKYVLVGRGIYALREWGYKSGTVSEIIAEILKNRGPLTKQEILEEVNKQRIIKKATVNLALMNKKIFRKVENNKYDLAIVDKVN